MSSVYLARQESLGRSVAVKVLHKVGSPRDAGRFLHEARIIASLQHRNIITIHDVGAVGGRHYISMEYLEGGSLVDRIEEGMSARQALDLLETIAACLDFVHRRGIIHGDIKPGNILFHSDGTPRLSDFGIAEQGQGYRPAEPDGRIYGSPHYLSPEQAEGLPRDGRSDIYGLGIVFHQMLTGRLPYEADSDVEILLAHLSSPIPLLPEALSGCQSLLEKMIAKRPVDRVRNAGELVTQIRETRAMMTRRGRLIDAVSHLLPARAITGRLKWPVVVRMTPAGRMVSVGGILLVLALGLGGLSYEAAPDRTMADEAVIVPSESEEGRAPLPTAQPEEPAAALSPQESPPSAGRVSTDAPAGNGMPASTPPDPAGERAAPEEATGAAVAFASIPSPNESPEVVAPAASKPAQRPPERPADPVSGSPSDDAVASVADLPAPADQDAKIAGWIQAAGRALAADRLTTPVDDNAYDRYRRVLELEPDHAEARSGLDRIAERYATMGRGALAVNRPSLARLYLQRGTQVRGDHPALRGLREELAQASRRRADHRRQVDPPEVGEVESAPVRGSAFDFENVADPSRGQQGSGNIIKDFKNAWRSIFD